MTRIQAFIRNFYVVSPSFRVSLIVNSDGWALQYRKEFARGYGLLRHSSGAETAAHPPSRWMSAPDDRRNLIVFPWMRSRSQHTYVSAAADSSHFGSHFKLLNPDSQPITIRAYVLHSYISRKTVSTQFMNPDCAPSAPSRSS
jgi:hypothetical protein